MKRYLLFLVVYNGFLSLVVEIIGSKVLAPYYSSTIYVWSALISIALGFLAIGYSVGARIVKKVTLFHLQLSFLLTSLGVVVPFILRTHVFTLTDSFSITTAPLFASLLFFSVGFTFMGINTSFLARLLLVESKSKETLVGNLYSLGTIGSLLGALSTAYILIPSQSLSSIFGILGVLTSIFGFLIRPKGYLALAMFTVCIFFELFFFRIFPQDTRVVFTYRDFLGKYEIINKSGFENPVYCLLIDSNEQGCFDPSNKIVTYHKFTSYISQSFEGNIDMLILGTGIGTYVNHWSSDRINFDLVDLNPKTVDMIKLVGSKWDSDRQKFINDDARQFVRKTDKKYDIVYNDLLTNLSPVPNVYSKEFNEIVKSKLNRNGVFVTHIIGKADGSDSLVNSIGHTLKHSFKNVYFLSITPQDHASYVYFLATDNYDVVGKINETIKSSLFWEATDKPFTLFNFSGELISDDFNRIEYLWSENINKNYTISRLRKIYKIITTND